MAVLALGTPVTVEDPVLVVENRLKPGRNRFELVVTDTAGLESDPALIDVTVFEPAPAPTPTPTPGPVIRPEILDRATVVTRPTVLRPTILRTLRP